MMWSLGSETLADSLGVRNMATLENPRMSLSDPSTFDELLSGTVSASGMRVGVKDSLRIAAVWQAVSMISGDIASLPCNCYRSGDYNEPDYTHPAQALVGMRSSECCTAYRFWRTLVSQVVLWGNAYAFVERLGGRGSQFQPVALLNLLPDRTQAEYLPDGRMVYVTETSDGKLHTLDYEDVIHVSGLGYDAAAGCKLIDYARDSFGLALSAINFASKFFKNGGRVGGVLMLDANTIKSSKDKVEEGFRKTYEGNDNPFKTVVLRDNAKFVAAQTSPRDSQLVESREEDVRDVARYCNLPPSRLGIKDSVSYNSAEQDRIAYQTGTLNHITTGITTELNAKLLTPEQRARRSHYFEFEYRNLIYTDVQTLAGVMSQLRTMESVSPNEVRKIFRFPPRPDAGGNTFTNPNTTAGTPAQPPQARRNEAAALCAQVVQRDRQRVSDRLLRDCRSLAKKPGEFLAWCDSGYEADAAWATDYLAPSCAALAAVRGLPEDESKGHAGEQAAELICAIKGRMRRYTDPPYEAKDLEKNVKAESDWIASTNGAWITANADHSE